MNCENCDQDTAITKMAKLCTLTQVALGIPYEVVFPENLQDQAH